MIVLQLLVNGIVTGCGLGIMAISFSLIYSTTNVLHVAHAGVYTLGGYLAWTLISHGMPAIPAFVLAIALCAVAGALIQRELYDRLANRRAAELVYLIASLGLLGIIQNALAAIFTADVLRFPLPWVGKMVGSGAIRLSYPQILTIAAGILIYGGSVLFTRYTVLGKQIRAVSSNPFLAEITRLRPRRIYRYVMAISSGMVCVLGILTPLDFGLRPYGGLTQLLIATVAMIAGGIGSLSGAFAVALGIGVLQNLALLVAPGDWSVAITFSIFVVFMLFKPTGLFRTN